MRWFMDVQTLMDSQNRSRVRLRVSLAWLLLALPAAVPAWSQAVPEGRVITHREQSLTPYDPFSAEELFKRI